MPNIRAVFAALSLSAAAPLLLSCGKSGSGAASDNSTGSYTDVSGAGLTIELKSGGGVVVSAPGVPSSTGTYTTDGEKLLLSIDNTVRTFIRDGSCIENQEYGKLCKGGAAGAASNVTTRSIPSPSGTWVASNTDGTFTLVFKPDNQLSLSVTPAAGGNPETSEGSFRIEGDLIYATLTQSVPLVLKYVNNAYESTSFGLPMRFVKQ